MAESASELRQVNSEPVLLEHNQSYLLVHCLLGFHTDIARLFGIDRLACKSLIKNILSGSLQKKMFTDLFSIRKGRFPRGKMRVVA